MSKKRSKTKLIIGLHLGLWLLLLAIYIFLFYPFYALGLSLLRSFGNLIPLIIIFYLNAYLINRFIEKGKYLTYLFFAILIVFVMIVIRVKINLFFPEIEASALLQDQAINWGIGALVTSLGILMLSSIYQILENRFRVESRNQAIINEQNEAQLQFLRAQINPHFLFNTLNNIYSLAVIKSDKTADMVLKLSTLLRYVIYDGKSEKVSIKREIKHISHFIDLFRMRSEQPPNIRFEQRGDTNHFLVEPMILIPIVENCFKHCDFDINENAFTEIFLSVENDELHFFTRNSKDQGDEQKDKTGGVGLGNIKKRLELKYPGQYNLKIEDLGSTFEVNLRLIGG